MIRNPKDFGVWPACPSGFGIPMDFCHGERDAYTRQYLLEKEFKK